MFRRILCVIGILWGCGIIVSFIARGGARGGGLYDVGQLVGVGLGALMIFAGFRGLRGKKKDEFEPID